MATVLTGLDAPNGVAWRNGSLYVAEVTRITRYDNADSHVLNSTVRACSKRWYNSQQMPTIYARSWQNAPSS